MLNVLDAKQSFDHFPNGSHLIPVLRGVVCAQLAVYVNHATKVFMIIWEPISVDWSSLAWFEYNNVVRHTVTRPVIILIRGIVGERITPSRKYKQLAQSIFARRW